MGEVLKHESQPGARGSNNREQYIEYELTGERLEYRYVVIGPRGGGGNLGGWTLDPHLLAEARAVLLEKGKGAVLEKYIAVLKGEAKP